MVGLNFASEDEAEKFRTAVESKIMYARRASKPQKPSLSLTYPLSLSYLPPSLLPPSLSLLPPPLSLLPTPPLSLSAMKRKPPPENKKPVAVAPPMAVAPPVSNNRDPYSLGGDSSEKGKPNKPKGKKLTKADIGKPTEFR